MHSELGASARALIDEYEGAGLGGRQAMVDALHDCQSKITARLKELRAGPRGNLVKHMRTNQKMIAEYAGYHRDAQAELNKQQKKSPQDAEELKRAEGNVAWYRNQLLPAQHDAYWTSHQHDPTWLEYNELRAEMDEISKLVGKPRRAAHSLGKSVFVPEAMRTYRRLGGC